MTKSGYGPVPPWTGRPAAVKDFWREGQPATFQGGNIRILSDDWNLVLLGLYVLVHRFAVLHWVAGFHALTHVCETSWPAAVKRAAEIGAHRKLRFARKICDMILGDDEIEANLAGRKEMQLAYRPFRSAPAQATPRSLRLAIRRRLGAKIAFIFEPQQVDREVVRLPSRLAPLYYVVRLGRPGTIDVAVPAVKSVWNSLGRLALFRSGGKGEFSDRRLN